MIAIQILLLFPILINCSQYEYLMFENFELTKNSFLKEQQIVKQLKDIRKSLHQQIEQLEGHKNRNMDLYNDNSTIPVNIPKLKQNDFPSSEEFLSHDLEISSMNKSNTNYTSYKDAYEGVFNHKLDFGNVNNSDVIHAALKGLIMIQETYTQDMEKYSKGHISFKDHVTETSRSTDSLKSEDLLTMSTIALNDFNWVDNAVTYLKAAINEFYSSTEENRANLPDGFEESLLTTKNQLSVYHNEMLAKKDNPIGTEWKLHPYRVDTGLNLISYIFFLHFIWFLDLHSFFLKSFFIHQKH